MNMTFLCQYLTLEEGHAPARSVTNGLNGLLI